MHQSALVREARCATRGRVAQPFCLLHSPIPLQEAEGDATTLPSASEMPQHQPTCNTHTKNCQSRSSSARQARSFHAVHSLHARSGPAAVEPMALPRRRPARPRRRAVEWFWNPVQLWFIRLGRLDLARRWRGGSPAATGPAGPRPRRYFFTTWCRTSLAWLSTIRQDDPRTFHFQRH